MTAEVRRQYDERGERQNVSDKGAFILAQKTQADPGTAEQKLADAAELKIPAALAVDSVRYSTADADARMRWATHVSARMLAGAFAVAWEWGNTELLSELIEYHCARGTFIAPEEQAAAWADTATATVPVEDAEEYALVASGGEVVETGPLTRLGALPPLRMDPDGHLVLGRYRELAAARYGREVIAAENEWSTWP